MFHCPVGVWVIEQHAIILSATVRSPTVYIIIWRHKATMGKYDTVNPKNYAYLLLSCNMFRSANSRIDPYPLGLLHSVWDNIASMIKQPWRNKAYAFTKNYWHTLIDTHQ